MNFSLWVLIYLGTSLFWAWILFGNGAERLESTFASGFLIDALAPRWSADGIKLFAWITWIGETIWFVLGLVDPQMRIF